MHWEGDDTQTHNKYIQVRNKQVQPHNNYTTNKQQTRNKHVTNIIEEYTSNQKEIQKYMQPNTPYTKN